MNIKKIIKENGMTATFVAKKMGIPVRRLNYTINEIPTYTNIETLRKIASVIGCKVGDFFIDEMTTSKLSLKDKD